MLVEVAPLWPIFLSAQSQKQPLVLATLVDVKGSSYKKPGAMLLIEKNGQTHGLLSGGCLEADIAEHATSVFDTGVSKSLHYDLSDDSIFGLGAGCDGQITILLQLLSDDYMPLAALNPFSSKSPSSLWLNHSDNEYPLGAYCVMTNGQLLSSHDDWQHAAVQQTALRYTPVPKVAICGAGTDALPVAKIMASLYWQVHMFDHRSALLNTEQWPENSQCHDTKNVQSICHSENIQAVIIMSHNIERDANYLLQAFKINVPFIGLLGPPKRRDKVLSKANVLLEDIKDRLHAPVGLNLGGRLPENIALSICAQLQQFFFKQ